MDGVDRRGGPRAGAGHSRPRGDAGRARRRVGSVPRHAPLASSLAGVPRPRARRVILVFVVTRLSGQALHQLLESAPVARSPAGPPAARSATATALAAWCEAARCRAARTACAPVTPTRQCPGPPPRDRHRDSIVNKTPLTHRNRRIMGIRVPSVYLKQLERRKPGCRPTGCTTFCRRTSSPRGICAAALLPVRIHIKPAAETEDLSARRRSRRWSWRRAPDRTRRRAG
jgi:hypothetical protein